MDNFLSYRMGMYQFRLENLKSLQKGSFQPNLEWIKIKKQWTMSKRNKMAPTEVAEIIKFIKKHFPPRESAQGHGPNVS